MQEKENFVETEQLSGLLPTKPTEGKTTDSAIAVPFFSHVRKVTMDELLRSRSNFAPESECEQEPEPAMWQRPTVAWLYSNSEGKFRRDLVLLHCPIGFSLKDPTLSTWR